MRKFFLTLAIILIIAIPFYLFVFGWLVPKSAMLTIPYKWRMIPLRQSKAVVIGYLGNPVLQDSSAAQPHDEWHDGSEGKAYLLRIDYHDTTAITYSIHYIYKGSLISKDYLIDSVSIR